MSAVQWGKEDAAINQFRSVESPGSDSLKLESTAKFEFTGLKDGINLELSNSANCIRVTLRKEDVDVFHESRDEFLLACKYRAIEVRTFCPIPQAFLTRDGGRVQGRIKFCNPWQISSTHCP